MATPEKQRVNTLKDKKKSNEKIFIQIALYLCASFAAAQNYKIEGSAPDMEGKVVYLGDMKSRSNFEK